MRGNEINHAITGIKNESPSYDMFVIPASVFSFPVFAECFELFTSWPTWGKLLHVYAREATKFYYPRDAIEYVFSSIMGRIIG